MLSQAARGSQPALHRGIAPKNNAVSNAFEVCCGSMAGMRLEKLRICQYRWYDRALAGGVSPRCSTHLYVAASVGPAPAGATTGGLHQDATEHLPGAHLPGALAALRRACPGGSDD